MVYLEGEAVFFKKLRATLKYGLHWDAVTSRWARELANEVGVLEGTKNNCELPKYGLHLDTVISRWAREHANEVGALDVTKKKRYIQTYRKFYSLFINPLFLLFSHKGTTKNVHIQENSHYFIQMIDLSIS